MLVVQILVVFFVYVCSVYFDVDVVGELFLRLCCSSR